MTWACDLFTGASQISSDDFLHYWKHLQTGATLSGCAGLNGNVVNSVAAIFLATGQDVAAAAESAASYAVFEKASPEEINRYQEESLFRNCQTVKTNSNATVQC